MAKPQRAFAMIAAITLFATSVAFSGLVVWQMYQKDPATDADNEFVQQQLELAKERANNEGGEGMLQGTKLENFTPVPSVPELRIIDIQEGTGEAVPEGGSVVAHYTGALASDGTIFQSSKDTGEPVPFSLSGVIEGWTKGVPGMKVGGIRRLLIPAAMAYGGNPPQGSGIPANADLVFDIELVRLGE